LSTFKIAEARGEAEKTERVRQEMADTVVTAMQRRFKNDVPDDLRERLEKYSQEELYEVVVRIVTAASAEEALGPDDGSSSIAPR